MPDGRAPPLWSQNAYMADLLLAALPAWQAHGEMGSSVLVEGWDRAQVEALFRLRRIAPAAQPDHWRVFEHMEHELRHMRIEQQRKAKAQREAGTTATKSITTGQTLGSMMRG